MECTSLRFCTEKVDINYCMVYKLYEAVLMDSECSEPTKYRTLSGNLSAHIVG